ncbi:hypothetical protein AYK26_01320 [Euryarchaeota archaeon SM23-78]|nr:MAG: hypothetical protein AYK26_01320 [Euryarchaeota archaeon SM23-78]MBW3000628.1 hypothetical protein [Candidatus Woesearchaeota archaeon]
MSPTNAAENEEDKGEIMYFMRDIKNESQAMMKDLMEIDDLLLSLKERLQVGRIDRYKIEEIIDSIRLRIGVIEREDKREMDEEEEAASLLMKLKKWVDLIV